ncbi:MAG: phosphatidylserine/phosphatidylglycerophosphate/cardiolipin synthase family protein [Actinomycetota bacterium]|nr:phosphatidylserine/phosphatidylglycerophosphate/cardiolipin synthase family protein [Actinomycetota bacterium]
MRGLLAYFFGLGLRVLLLLAAAQAALVGIVEAVATIRRKFLLERPQEGFPWEERPEIELESGDVRLKLYPQYEMLYEAMLEEIERAEERVFVETFIWQDDGWGNRFVEALARKAREGVAVYAVFDELANLGQPKEFKRFPEEINLLRFRRVSGPLGAINPRSAHRDHRKLLAVDGRVAFVGGFNIGDLYTTWRDTHLRLRGDVAHEVERAFVDFWNTHRSAAGGLPEIEPLRESSWDPSTALLVNDPYRHTLPIRDSYLTTINRANEHVYLTTAYFTPGPAYREALLRAAERGVDVQVLFPQASNHALVDWLARPYLGELLRGGVRIFMYKDFMLHAKTATADGVWATVGSANVDTLSFFGLHETNLEVYSERFAAQMEETFELDKTNAEEITLEKWESRALPVKLLEWGLAPLRVFG